ncbi:conserved hypothetical protein [Talaromyces stipitatus ATCC 10500]|uniref:CCHC-type domain-containing protein n=1 Tax=Talaromyces stipitatus (strain ATCC 10500 / CBS 375.48 / QM 6759 / NRRL 1006) TaxID=441959 RepID=B8MA79_TALSN|nr:uncharacterized protein TSTA_121510 [Talaromyces stipitatus ATCC 10500]EED18408.1 conserved hypothetical protein [Talaromyces stipitatus ATCC 10500]
MIKTVDITYAQTAIHVTTDIATAYANLREQREIRAEYSHLIEIPRAPKSWEAWISAWEKVMIRAMLENLSFAKDSTEWANNFLDALKPYFDTWVTAYRMSKEKEIDNGSLDYRTLSGAFRRHATATKRSTGKVGKGAFAVTYGDSEEQDGNLDATPSIRINPQGDRRRGNKKRNRTIEGSISESGKPRCRACGILGHMANACWYIFPKKAPKKWYPKEGVQEKVDSNLREDNKLAEEIARIKNPKASNHDDKEANE